MIMMVCLNPSNENDYQSKYIYEYSVEWRQENSHH